MKFSARFSAVAAAILLLLCNKVYGQVNQRTLMQIDNLVAEKQSRTATEQKISSQLLQAVRELQGRQMATGVSLRPAAIVKDDNGAVKVDINATVTDALLLKIKSAGGQVIFSSVQFHSVVAMVSLRVVPAIAAFDEVKFIKPAARPHINGAPHNIQPAKNNMPGVSGNAQNRKAFKARNAAIKKQLEKYTMVFGAGAGNSQGDHAHGADSARIKYGYQGAGVRVGVISDSYNRYKGAAADVTAGDLPGTGNPNGNTTPVTVLADDATGADEGRAMLQIVHDLAPKAQLFFAPASTEAGFAANIIALRNAPYNCDIIIDDIGYADEPVFQDGIIAQAINQVTKSGAMYFSAAGNTGSLLMNTSAVWMGDFTDVGSKTLAGTGKAGTVHNFGTSAKPELGDSVINIADYTSTSYFLRWADPLGGSANDYDLFYVNKSGNILASSTDVQSGSQDPFEEIDFNTASVQPGDQLVVFKKSTAQARAFILNTDVGAYGPAFKRTTAGNIIGHPSAALAYCVAAADASAAYPGVFKTTTKVESYSVDGPARYFFNADTTPVTTGNFLFATSGGVVRSKPDITAADNVTTKVHGTTEFTLFPGTSAAAPHAGAIAAIIKSAKPTLTAAQIRNYITSTPLDIHAAGWDINSGYGIAQPVKAIQALLVACPVAVTQTAALAGCNSAVYRGKTYSASTVVIDTIKSAAGCDSVYKTVTITITKITAVTKPVTLAGCNNVVYKSKTYTASATVRDTVRSVQGCDSIYNVATITITKITPVTKPVTLTGCNSVVYKSITYTASTTVKDTVRSVQGCDSIYNVATITITKITPVTRPVTLTGCNSVVYKSVTYTASTTVRDTVRSVQGCDSIYNVATITIKVTPVTKPVTVTGCSSVVYKTKTYTSSTTVRDTVRTTGGCDSIYNVATITVNPKPNLGKDTTVFICAGATINIKGLYNTTAYATVLWKVPKPDSAVAGIDTLVVTTAAGCKDTAVVTVKANALPAKPTITKAGSTSFCSGDSLILTANTTTGTLQWLRNGAAIKKAAANRYAVKLDGTYKLLVTNASGCSILSDSVVVKVTQLAAPVITLVNDTLISTYATGNQWYQSGMLLPGITSYKYSPDYLDAYTVQATVNGCKSPMSLPYYYTANTFGKKSVPVGMSLKLFPNPAISAAHLNIAGATGKVVVTLTDVAGRQLWQSAKVGNGIVTIPLQTVAQGTYLVTVSDGIKLRSFKLVKQ